MVETFVDNLELVGVLQPGLLEPLEEDVLPVTLGKPAGDHLAVEVVLLAREVHAAGFEELGFLEAGEGRAQGLVFLGKHLHLDLLLLHALLDVLGRLQVLQQLLSLLRVGGLQVALELFHHGSDVLAFFLLFLLMLALALLIGFGRGVDGFGRVEPGHERGKQHDCGVDVEVVLELVHDEFGLLNGSAVEVDDDHVGLADGLVNQLHLVLLQDLANPAGRLRGQRVCLAEGALQHIRVLVVLVVVAQFF